MEYAGIAGTASGGIQEGISGSMGFNVFVAVNNLAKNDLEMSPSTFEGVTESVGASIDFKAIAGAGLNVSGFSMISGWTGGL